MQFLFRMLLGSLLLMLPSVVAADTKEKVEIPSNANGDVPIEISFGKPAEYGPNIGIQSLKIISDQGRSLLAGTVNYSGGCSRHDYEFWWDGKIEKANPPNIELRFVHKPLGGDPCRAIQSKKFLVDLSPILKVETVFNLHLVIHDKRIISVSYP